MRTLATLTLAAASALALAGCDQPSLAQVEARAQTIASATCGFIPTADTIARIVIPLASAATGAGSPATIEQAAAATATAICGAVTAKGARRDVRHVPTVRGVAVHGTFRDGRVI